MNSCELIRQIVTAGGGRFMGIQSGIIDGKRLFKDVALFNSPQTGSTLAMPAEDVSVAAVRRRIAESDAQFGIAKP